MISLLPVGLSLLMMHSDSAGVRPHLGFSISNLFLGRVELLAHYNIAERVGASLKAGYDYCCGTNAPNSKEVFHAGYAQVGPYNDVVFRGGDFRFRAGVFAGRTWYIHRLTIQIPGFYGDYIEKRSIRLSQNFYGFTLALVATGRSASFSLGVQGNLWHPRTDSLAALTQVYYVPPAGAKWFGGYAPANLRGFNVIPLLDLTFRLGKRSKVIRE